MVVRHPDECQDLLDKPLFNKMNIRAFVANAISGKHFTVV